MATTPRPQVSPLIRELMAIGVIRISADNTTLLLPDGTAFTPSGGSVTSDDITDATAIGKAILTAADAAAAKTALDIEITDISNATAFGQAWLAVIDAAGGRAAIGATETGALLITASDPAAGRSAIGLTEQAAVPDATDPASTQSSLNLVLARLRNLGLLAT